MYITPVSVRADVTNQLPTQTSTITKKGDFCLGVFTKELHGKVLNLGLLYS